MPHKYINIICIILLFSCKVSAQIVISSGAQQLQPSVQIQVRDSASTDFLPGASVFVMYGADTLKLAADSNGSASYMVSEFRHTPVILQTSYLGFETRRDTVDLNLINTTIVNIRLREDPLQLNSLIIKGDAVAMVMHGDTTVFNAAAFMTMKGSALRDLLGSLPGVKVAENGVTYNGQSIDRILFNGNNLFGKNMKDAMNMVLADEVKSVEVYERESVESLNPDLCESRERVMDVHTWKPLEHVGQLNSLSEIGVYTAETSEEGHEMLLSENLQIGNYALASKPRFSASVQCAKNPVLTGMTSDPGSSLSALLQVGKDVAGKGGYEVTFDGKIDNRHSERGSLYLFSGSELWKNRFDSSYVCDVSKDERAGLHLNAYARHGKTVLRLNAGLDYSHNMSDNLNSTSSRRDESTYAFEKKMQKGTDRIDFNLKPMIDIPMAKKRRKLQICPRFDISVLEGDGSRLDTLPASISREWLTCTLSERTVRPSLELRWTEPLLKKASIIIETINDFTHSDVTHLYTDVFSGGIDQNNSRDYTQNFLTNTVDVSFVYGRKNDGFYTKSSIGVKDIIDIRNERLGSAGDCSRNYLRPLVALDLSYAKGENTISFKYFESETVPNAVHLRNVVDDSNPIILTAGNSDLELSVCRNLTLSAGRSFAKQNMTATLAAQAALYSNSIESKTTYFSSETWIDRYGYMAPAGSSLVTPENVQGRRQLGITLQADKYFSKIKSNMIASIGWDESTRPYFLEDVLHFNSNESVGTDIFFRHNGESDFIALMAGAHTGLQECDGEALYYYLNVSASAEYKQRFLDKVELHMHLNHNFEKTTIEGLQFNNTCLSVKLSWLFGKDKSSSVGVFGDNILNDNALRGNVVTNDYIVHSDRVFLGRVIGVSLNYVFRRR